MTSDEFELLRNERHFDSVYIFIHYIPRTDLHGLPFWFWKGIVAALIRHMRDVADAQQKYGERQGNPSEH